MHRLFYLFLFLVVGSFQLHSQSFEIISPAGLTPPYEVSPGTEVTFKYDFFWETPTALFTHTEEPVFPGFGTDPLWVEYTNSVDNGDGTFNISVTINEDVWVWAGFFSSFISQWNYTEIYEFKVASDVVISGDDLLLCDDGMDTETLSVMDTFSNYQWYMDGIEISGATTAIYEVSQPGSYYVAATYNSETENSNTLNLSFIELSFSGALGGNSDVVLTGTSGMDTYQWFSGTDAGNLSPINGANSETYNAPITTTLTFYSLEATLGSCTVQSDIRSIVESFFTPPTIQIQADTNSFNVICEGTSVTYSVEDNYDSYKWLRDGTDASNSFNSITLSQVWQEANYSVEVTNTEWPEIVLTSAVVNLNYQDVIEPQLVGVSNFQKYCPGDNLDVLLGDEGYVYTWYLHNSFNNYTNDDIISVVGSTYSFTFDTAVYVTVVGEFQGCTANKTVFLDSYSNSNIFLNTADFNQDYLCPDSMNTIFIPSWAAGDYQDFQWYQEVNGIFEPIAGADNTLLEIDMPGVYQLQASVAACPSVIVTSSNKIIFDYTERELFIWSTDETLCVGDAATLNISGGNNWEDIQWFEEDIVIGSSGYEKTYIPMIGAGSDASQIVTEFQTYEVKARHFSCPNGLKTTSNILGLRPTVNPSITPDPNYGINQWHVSAYDSIANYVFCQDEPVQLTLSGSYDSYTWHSLPYAGDDDYELGNEIAGATTGIIDVLAEVDWFTAVVDSAGCVGYSDPILLDTWVFLAPTITSYNNSELCMEGDSTLFHISFPGDWTFIEWYLDGNLIPDSNNDSIYATIPGTYTVTAYPTVCPQFGYSSGVGPTVSYLYADILENDTVIYAVPELGFYTYQWYFNGDPIPSGPQPWTLYKDSLMNGTYTVEVSNDDCTVLSDGFDWGQVLSVSTSASPDILACFGDSNGSILITPSGGSPDYTYTWDNATVSGNNPMNLPAGTYCVTVTDALGDAVDTCVDIAQPSELTIAMSSTAELDMNGDGTATATVGGGTTDYTYSWDSNPVQTTETATGLSNGTYNVTVTDANGCEILGSVAVDQMTGLEYFQEITYFNLFPNPSDGKVFLEMDFDKNLDMQIQLFNSLGQEVILMKLKNVNSVRETYDWTRLPKGMYWLSLSSKEEHFVQKVILE